LSNSSIGRGPASGGNENHDGDPLNTTMGETVQQEPPAGNELNDEAAPDVPDGVKVSKPDPGIVTGPPSHPGGLDIETNPREPDPARGKLPEP
jgi:hypothetical protein